MQILNGSAIPGLGPIQISWSKSDLFYEDLRTSHFVLCPRGDAFFSYRFSEVLAAGAIPIVFDDGWVLPLEEIIEWKRSAVIVGQSQLPTLPLLLAGRYSATTICEMRTMLFRQYRNYLQTPEHWLKGIDLILARRQDIAMQRAAATV